LLVKKQHAKNVINSHSYHQFWQSINFCYFCSCMNSAAVWNNL